MSVGTDYGYKTSTVYQREQAEKEALSSGKVTHSDFLKLLTKQLTTQDPLNPMQDLDFTAQLAQLQALDEQIAMTKSMQALRVDSQLQAGTSMIGKYISGTDEAGATVTGLVGRVVQTDGNIYVELANKTKVPVSNINNVWNDANSMNQDFANSGNVIGMWVEAGYDEAKQPIRGIIEKVLVNNGQVSFQLYGGQTVTWNQISEMRAPTDAELLYTLPDEIRAKVEKADAMTNKGVTGFDSKGNKVSGIVAGWELDGSNVNVVLYSGEKIELSKLDGEPRKPTAADAAHSLKDLWVVGLAEDGTDLEGKVMGATEENGSIVLALTNGQYVYLDTVEAIRKPTEEDLASAWAKSGSAPGGDDSGAAEDSEAA